METVSVRCRTNIDDYHYEVWPEVMCCRPVKGDIVAAKSGKRLVVVGVAHNLTKAGTPYLDVELHKSA